MRTKVGFMVAIAGLLILMTAIPVAAGYKDKTWFLGAQGGYFSVPGIGMYYEDYTSISGASYGIQSGYSWDFIEAVGFLENWTINIDEADWLLIDAEPEDMTRIRYNVGMVSLEGMARFKFRVHEIVQPLLGVGLGIGFSYGNIESRDYDAFGNFETEWEDKNRPPILPVVDIMAGCRFVVPENVTFDLNLGFKNGLYAGLGVVFFY